MKEPIVVENQSKKVAIELGKECVKELGKTVRRAQKWSRFEQNVRVALISGSIGFMLALLLVTLRLLS